jgi:hypothetical protein
MPTPIVRPGHGKAKLDDQRSLIYNKHIALQTVRWAMVEWMTDEHRRGLWGVRTLLSSPLCAHDPAHAFPGRDRRALPRPPEAHPRMVRSFHSLTHAGTHALTLVLRSVAQWASADRRMRAYRTDSTSTAGTWHEDHQFNGGRGRGGGTPFMPLPMAANDGWGPAVPPVPAALHSPPGDASAPRERDKGAMDLLAEYDRRVGEVVQWSFEDRERD